MAPWHVEIELIGALASHREHDDAACVGIGAHYDDEDDGAGAGSDEGDTSTWCHNPPPLSQSLYLATVHFDAL